MVGTAVQIEDRPAPLSEISRLTGVFFNPKQTFADIAERPRWIVPLILMVVAGLVLVFCFSHHVGFERMIAKSIDQSSRAATMTPEQRAQAISMGSKFAPIMGYISPLIFNPALILTVAAVLMMIVNATFSSEVRFGQMAGITAYAFLPQVLFTVLATVVIFLKDPEDYDLKNPLGFNIGAYLGDTTPKWLMSLATSFDMFSFWVIVLLATGIVAATRKPAWGKALAAVILPWLLVVVVKAGFAGIFG